MMKALSRMRLGNWEHFFTTDTKLSGSRVDEPMKKETLALIKKTVSNQILRALENEGVSFDFHLTGSHRPGCAVASTMFHSFLRRCPIIKSNLYAFKPS